MEGSRWSRYLEDPSRLAVEEEDPVGTIATLLQRSPYCHVLQLLQCKALKDSDRIDWKEKARERSILVPDRRKLFQLLQERSPEPLPPEKEAGEGEKASDSEANQEDQPSSVEEKVEEVNEADGIDPAPLEQEILSEAVQKRILYDAEDALVEEENSEEEGPTDKDKGEEEEAKDTDSKGAGKKSFMDWLDPSPKEEKESEHSEQELIRAFIKEGKEHPVKKEEEKEFFSSERMAEKSSDESTLPVSETLAELYVQQGELKRAIEAFEKLRLKVPEKSDYFAGRIQELKERSKR